MEILYKKQKDGKSADIFFNYNGLFRVVLNYYPNMDMFYERIYFTKSEKLAYRIVGDFLLYNGTIRGKPREIYDYTR